jgi:hypothetical protein
MIRMQAWARWSTAAAASTSPTAPRKTKSRFHPAMAAFRMTNGTIRSRRRPNLAARADMTTGTTVPMTATTIP